MRLSDEAVASYRAAAAALDPRLDALVALLVCDGLKVAEALALDIDDVSGKPPATTITVRRRGQSKRIVLDHDSARAVRRCIGKRRSGPGLRQRTVVEVRCTTSADTFRRRSPHPSTQNRRRHRNR